MIILVTLLALTSWATEISDKLTFQQDSVECSLNDETRSLKVETWDGDNGAVHCKTLYKRPIPEDIEDSEFKDIAKSRVGSGYCYEIQDRVATNLVTAGFRCQ